jgi:hypothetical protein
MLKKKKLGSIFKELLKFLPKKFSICSQIYGFGIRDPGSGKTLFRIPDPGVNKAPDPQHWKIINVIRFLGFLNSQSVLRIRIRRISMFLGLLDPDPFVRGMDSDPSIIKEKY